MTLDCSRIAKEIAMMSGLFVEGRRQTIAQNRAITSNEP